MLSKRAVTQMEETAKSPLFSAIFRTFGNQVSMSFFSPRSQQR